MQVFEKKVDFKVINSQALSGCSRHPDFEVFGEDLKQLLRAMKSKWL